MRAFTPEPGDFLYGNSSGYFYVIKEIILFLFKVLT